MAWIQFARDMRAGWPLILLSVFLAVPFILTACRPEPPVIKIGFAAPFEGRNRPVGYDAIYAARLAIREQNAAGGIGPYRLGLVALDDGGQAGQAMEVAHNLVRDEEVVAVIGHWLPETNQAAEAVYAPAGMPLIVLGAAPFGPFPTEELPAGFTDAYAAVTPFAETAGSYSGPTYDAIQLLFAALAQAAESGPVTRERVQAALASLTIEGITGPVHAP